MKTTKLQIRVQSAATVVHAATARMLELARDARNAQAIEAARAIMAALDAIKE